MRVLKDVRRFNRFLCVVFVLLVFFFFLLFCTVSLHLALFDFSLIKLFFPFDRLKHIGYTFSLSLFRIVDVRVDLIDRFSCLFYAHHKQFAVVLLLVHGVPIDDNDDYDDHFRFSDHQVFAIIIFRLR